VKVLVVYGTERKGCTYQIAQEVIKKLGDVVLSEIFLPRDLPEYCISCFRCFSESPGTCAHSKYTKPIREKLIDADVIILTSPVYSFHVTGQMKVFLDHFANMWLVHRPEEKMFKKQGIVISAASGPVYKKTLLEMKDSLDFWGVARTYQIGVALMETNWDNVSRKIKDKVDKKASMIGRKIQKCAENPHLSFRVRKWFYISRVMQKYIKMNPPDVAYWEGKGWVQKVRPWR
jgi:multimeric flavodoxin WrbA